MESATSDRKPPLGSSLGARQSPPGWVIPVIALAFLVIMSVGFAVLMRWNR
jgi:hypothetical protein